VKEHELLFLIRFFVIRFFFIILKFNPLPSRTRPPGRRCLVQKHSTTGHCLCVAATAPLVDALHSRCTCSLLRVTRRSPHHERLRHPRPRDWQSSRRDAAALQQHGHNQRVLSENGSPPHPPRARRGAGADPSPMATVTHPSKQLCTPHRFRCSLSHWPWRRPLVATHAPSAAVAPETPQHQNHEKVRHAVPAQAKKSTAASAAPTSPRSPPPPPASCVRPPFPRRRRHPLCLVRRRHGGG